MILTISFWLYIIKLGSRSPQGKKQVGTFFLKGGRKAISTAKDGKLIGGLFAAGEVDFTFQKIMGIFSGTHCHATFPLKEIAGLKGQLLTTIVP